MPPVPAAAVPLRTPVVALNVTPLGKVSLLFSLSVGTGEPLAVTVKLPGLPTVKVVPVALVNAGDVAGARSRTVMEYCGKRKLTLDPLAASVCVQFARLDWPLVVMLWAVSWALPYCHTTAC